MSLASGNGSGTSSALALDGLERELHQLLEGQHLRAAELVGRAGFGACHRRRARSLPRRRRRTPAGMRFTPPPISGSAGASTRHRGEAVEEVVLRPEHDRGPHDDRVRHRGAHQLLGLAPWCARSAKANSRRRRSPTHGRRARHAQLAASATCSAPSRMHGVEFLAAALGRMPTRLIDARRRRAPRPRPSRHGGYWPAPRGSGRPGRAAADGRRARAGAPRRGCGSGAWPARGPHAGRGNPSRRKR